MQVVNKKGIEHRSTYLNCETQRPASFGGSSALCNKAVSGVNGEWAKSVISIYEHMVLACFGFVR